MAKKAKLFKTLLFLRIFLRKIANEIETKMEQFKGTYFSLIKIRKECYVPSWTKDTLLCIKENSPCIRAINSKELFVSRYFSTSFFFC